MLIVSIGASRTSWVSEDEDRVHQLRSRGSAQWEPDKISLGCKLTHVKKSRKMCCKTCLRVTLEDNTRNTFEKHGWVKF